MCDKNEIVYGGTRTEVAIQLTCLARGGLGQLAPSSAHRPAQRLSNGMEYSFAPIAGEGDRVRGDVVDKFAQRLIYRCAPSLVDVGFVECDCLLGRLGYRRPGKLIKDKVALAVLVGESE
jgi:hypothetical protein